MGTYKNCLALAASWATILNAVAQLSTPQILTQPTNRIAYIGSSATFSVTVSASPSPSYQWRFNELPLLNETNSTLKLSEADFTNAGPYSVLVGSAGSAVASEPAWLSVMPTNIVNLGGDELRFGELSAPIWEASRINDQGPFVTGDGLTLYYSSSAPGGSGNLDLWAASRATLSSPWGQPVNLGAIVNSAADDTDPTLSPDELSLYFSSNRPGGQGHYDLWVATRPALNAPFGAPVNLGTAINSVADDDLALVSADGRTLLLGSDRSGGLGANDIWMSTRTNVAAPWEPAQHLPAPINSSSGGTFPVALSRDGLLLFFKSWRSLVEGPEPGAIYISRRASADQPFGPPVVARPILGIGTGGADYCSLSKDERTLYVGSYRTLYPNWPQLVQIDITHLPQLAEARAGASSPFTFKLMGRPGATYELQSSTDLNKWTSLSKTNITGDSAVLSDPASSTVGHQCYRALSH